MREREEEIRNINKGMHQVNEIYKVSNKSIVLCNDQFNLFQTSQILFDKRYFIGYLLFHMKFNYIKKNLKLKFWVILISFEP